MVLPSPIEEVGMPIEEGGTPSTLFPASVEEERSLSSLSAPLVSAMETAVVHVVVGVADGLVLEVVEDDVQLVDDGNLSATASGGGEPAVSLLCSSLPETVEHTDSGHLVMGEDFIFANSIVVAEDLHAREACPVAAMSPASGSSCPLGDSVVFDSVGWGDGGSVSEEVRVALVARETLRS
ncbi:hypothetical protein Dimus_029160 [Dionaea muscipula]